MLFLITLSFASASLSDDKPTPKTVVNQITEGVSSTSAAGTNTGGLTAFPDKSIWYVQKIGDTRGANRGYEFTYCWFEGPETPRCKEVVREKAKR